MKLLSQREILKERRLAPKKWLGQNLLVNETYLARIVRASGIRSGESVVEIGAGLGALTEALLKAGANVVALEIDSGFFRVLQEKFAGNSMVEIIHGDALAHDFRALADRVGKLRVVANLPYSISSRLLFRFVEMRDVIGSVHVLLQREVARRLAAEAGSKDYGILTALLGVTAQVDPLFDIPPHAFHPVPAVHSTFVRVVFPERLDLPVPDQDLLIRLVKAAFRARRKTLRNNLLGSRWCAASDDAVERAAARCAIDLNRRAETLSPAEFARFAAEIAAGRDALP
ncbi:MAG: 16S rRNA (adenine(1518)-N(6)/adenine(1519)-N(6))-dimethyltransferase RsmA [Desulfomonilaceae bacterium]